MGTMALSTPRAELRNALIGVRQDAHAGGAYFLGLRHRESLVPGRGPDMEKTVHAQAAVAAVSGREP